MTDDLFLNSPRSHFRAGMVVDAVKILGFPLFDEGALSPLDDILDFITAGALVRLLGWQWEFLPSLIAELVPASNLIPFWMLAVANVYPKWKQGETAVDQIQEHRIATRAELERRGEIMLRRAPNGNYKNLQISRNGGRIVRVSKPSPEQSRKKGLAGNAHRVVRVCRPGGPTTRSSV